MSYASTSPTYWTGSTFASLPKNLETSELTNQAILSGQKELPTLWFGTPGTGKTTLMRLALEHLSRSDPGSVSYRTSQLWLDRQVIWAQVSDFCRDVKAEIDYAKRWADWSERQGASYLSRAVPMLFLDDLGVEQLSDYNLDTICSMIDERYRLKRKTWLTTNLSVQDIGKRYGSRTLSRLAEMCDFVEQAGADRRMSRLLARAALG
jgi:DNA replication protein DnaC